MCHFMFLSFRDGPRWALMGLVVKLAQSVSCSHSSSSFTSLIAVGLFSSLDSVRHTPANFTPA